MTVGQLEDAAMNGAVFRYFTYCFSVFVMTFRRGSGVRFYPTAAAAGGDALAFGALSGVLGWWGIPWGPIFTVPALYRAAKGGTDVTREMLTATLGPTKTERILAERRPAKAGALLWLFRVLLLAGLLVPFAVLGLGAMAARQVHEKAKQEQEALRARPGYQKLAKAEGLVVGLKPPSGDETVDFLEAALADVCRQIVTAGAKGRTLKPGQEPRAWAAQHGDVTVAIVHLASAGNYAPESRERLAEDLWHAACGMLAAREKPAKGMVVVALRGSGGRYHALSRGAPPLPFRENAKPAEKVSVDARIQEILMETLETFPSVDRMRPAKAPSAPAAEAPAPSVSVPPAAPASPPKPGSESR